MALVTFLVLVMMQCTSVAALAFSLLGPTLYMNLLFVLFAITVAVDVLSRVCEFENSWILIVCDLCITVPMLFVAATSQDISRAERWGALFLPIILYILLLFNTYYTRPIQHNEIDI